MSPDASTLLWLVPLLVWEVAWKGVAMWRAARNNQLGWFVAVFILNTLGVLPMLYLKFFQKK